jgi:hypothetical protein
MVLAVGGLVALTGVSSASASASPHTVASISARGVVIDTGASTADPKSTISRAFPLLVNPQSNVAPSPDFFTAGTCAYVNGAAQCANPCVTPQLGFPETNFSATCTSYLLQAINNARASEGITAMVLPSNWYSLSVPQQLFVVANLERTARGMPAYLGINVALSANAQAAANSDSDPSVAKGFVEALDPGRYPAMGGAWSAGFNVLAADYTWMYEDGWGGSPADTSNIACTSPSSLGCWAHRDELLGSDPAFNPGVGATSTTSEMGVGYALVNGSGSFVDLIERPAHTPPAMVFTWANELKTGY